MTSAIQKSDSDIVINISITISISELPNIITYSLLWSAHFGLRRFAEGNSNS